MGNPHPTYKKRIQIAEDLYSFYDAALAIGAELPEIKVVSGGNMLKDVDTLKKLPECDGVILDEECKGKRMKKILCVFGVITIFLLGTVTALMILDKKDKIDIEKMIKKYTAKLHD